MKTLLTAIMGAGMLCGVSVCLAQAPAAQTAAASDPTAPTSPAPVGAVPRIAPGSLILVQLTRGIDAKKVKTGDPVEARLIADLKTAKGEVVMPKDSRIVGHVTVAHGRSKEQKESDLGLGFDHAVTKDGDVPLALSIQAIVAPPHINPDAGSPAVSSSAVPDPNLRMGGNDPRPEPSAPNTDASSTSTGRDPMANNAGGPRPAITEKTQGMVGYPNMTLAAANTAPGSVVSSEKSNVKLESGSMVLLRVSP